MIAILKVKWQLFLRRPGNFLAMTFMILIFAYFIGGIGLESKYEVPVFADIDDVVETELWERLNESEVFDFILSSEEEAKRLLEENRVEAIIAVGTDDFTIYTKTETPNASLLYQTVRSVYTDLALKENILQAAQGQQVFDKNLEDQLSRIDDELFFTIESDYFYGDGTVKVDMRLQSLFGFSLFFVIYTIAYNLLYILQEKQSGIWDRMIVSPLRKWQMYVANLLYSFVPGYIQVALIFVLFRLILGIDFYGGFTKTLIILIPYVFCITALSMCVVSLSKSDQHLHVIIPLISVSFAMLGGAYWPMEVVTSEIMLLLAKFVPITYGMEAMKLATVYQQPLQEIMPSLSVLFLMGVILMGIGIQVMEKRHI